MAKTILIVEDDPNISELVQMYLEKEGYNTRIASDGGQGLDPVSYTHLTLPTN